MFDPDRDQERAGWPFAARLAVVASVTLLSCFALWPSISGYGSGGSDTESKACVALLDGWHAQHVDPGPDAPLEAQSAFSDWQDGPGRCVTEGRHRLFESAIGLIAILGGTLTGMVVVRRRRLRPHANEPASVWQTTSASGTQVRSS